MATATQAVIDNTFDDPGRRPTLVTGGQDFASVTDMVCSIAERGKPPLAWYVAFGIASSLAAMFFGMIPIHDLLGLGVIMRDQVPNPRSPIPQDH